MNRLAELSAAEIEAEDALRAVGAIPEVLPPTRCGDGGVRALGAGPRRASGGAERARATGRVVTLMPGIPEPPDPRFPVWDPHPHPLDLLACWLVPALGDPHWSTPPCIREPEPEASL